MWKKRLRKRELRVDWLDLFIVLTSKVWQSMLHAVWHLYTQKHLYYKCQIIKLYGASLKYAKKSTRHTRIIHFKAVAADCLTHINHSRWHEQTREMEFNKVPTCRYFNTSMPTTKISLHSNNRWRRHRSSSVLSVHKMVPPSFTISLTTSTSSIIKLIFFSFSLSLSLAHCLAHWRINMWLTAYSNWNLCVRLFICLHKLTKVSLSVSCARTSNTDYLQRRD